MLSLLQRPANIGPEVTSSSFHCKASRALPPTQKCPARPPVRYRLPCHSDQGVLISKRYFLASSCIQQCPVSLDAAQEIGVEIAGCGLKARVGTSFVPTRKLRWWFPKPIRVAVRIARGHYVPILGSSLTVGGTTESLCEPRLAQAVKEVLAIRWILEGEGPLDAHPGEAGIEGKDLRRFPFGFLDVP